MPQSQELDLYETIEPQSVSQPQAVPQVTTRQSQINWAAVLFGSICLILVAMLYFETRGGDSPDPEPPANVTEEVAGITVEYVEMLAAGADEVAKLIEDGKVKTAQEVKDASRQLTEFAKQKTFVEKIGKLDNKGIGTEQLKPGAASHLRDVAEGHRQAVGK